MAVCRNRVKKDKNEALDSSFYEEEKYGRGLHFLFYS
jgi:hypothetical protein